MPRRASKKSKATAKAKAKPIPPSTFECYVFTPQTDGWISPALSHPDDPILKELFLVRGILAGSITQWTSNGPYQVRKLGEDVGHVATLLEARAIVEARGVAYAKGTIWLSDDYGEAFTKSIDVPRAA